MTGLTQEQADLLYSALAHLHDDRYSLLGHNHNGDYSALGHNHNGDYSALGHTHAVPVKVEQNSQSGAYTLVLSDAGKHILHPSADTMARTFTIPANGSVAFEIGTVITFINQVNAGVLTIGITTDTLRLAGAGTTGSRTLAADGIATALKVTSTEWLISGVGLT